jgi:hypothetical protein
VLASKGLASFEVAGSMETRCGRKSGPDQWVDGVLRESHLTVEKRRLRVSLAQLMGLIALVAVGCRWPSFLIVLLPAAAYFATSFGLPKAFAPVLLALYAPCLIGFWSDCAHCRQTWTFLWPVVPGGAVWMLSQRFLGFPAWSDPAVYAISALITVVIIGVGTFVAARGRSAVRATVFLFAVLSTIVSVLASSALRM